MPELQQAICAVHREVQCTQCLYPQKVRQLERLGERAGAKPGQVNPLMSLSRCVEALRWGNRINLQPSTQANETLENKCQHTVGSVRFVSLVLTLLTDFSYSHRADWDAPQGWKISQTTQGAFQCYVIHEHVHVLFWLKCHGRGIHLLRNPSQYVSSLIDRTCYQVLPVSPVFKGQNDQWRFCTWTRKLGLLWGQIWSQRRWTTEAPTLNIYGRYCCWSAA